MKKDSLAIKIVQKNLIWEDEKANLAAFEALISEQNDADLILLPEMFATGFSMRPEQFADGLGRILEWMKNLAKRSGAALCGSAMVADEGNYFNRLYFVKPDGAYSQYDKRHLFTMGQEPGHYSSGRDRVVINYLGWKILPLVCYDLRFPVFSRNDCGYDILVYVANWPGIRAGQWQTLLRARAVENQAYVLACNRVGVDGNGTGHHGDSGVIDFRGEGVLESSGKEEILEATLSLADLKDAREKFPVLRDADHFSADWK